LLSRKFFESREILFEAVINSLISLIRETLDTKGQFHLALTGGGIGGEIAGELARRINQDPEDFRGLHVWWSDERFVPYDSAEGNSFTFLSELSESAEIHIHRPASSDSNIDVDTSARRYAADIYGVAMDLTLLSVGADGHIASLFPGQMDQSEIRDVIAIHDAPKNPPQRVTFSLKKINESSRIWLLASGDEKAPIVERLLSQDRSLPVTHVEARQETLLFTDFSHK